ncbi:Asp/Glu racemase [Cupriavidus pinatubonensis]|uniref:Asp/Glu racemase n=1 Tax=Cupriavidus pinatubonensis TaxID=248026 RepID=UPI0031456E82
MEVFDSAAARLDMRELSLAHCVRVDLLTAAEAAGGLVPTIQGDTVDALLNLSRDADAVLLTCSTLGPAADVANKVALVPVLRVDAALAREATRAGGKVVALCAVQTTVQATLQIFSEAAAHTGAEVHVKLVEGAWDQFKAGDFDTYLELIAKAVITAQSESKCTVALAQASMTNAADHFVGGNRPLTSPSAGLLAAARAAHTRA